MDDLQKHLLALSAKIVGAHVAHNEVPSSALPDMIRNVYSTLSELGGPIQPVVQHEDLEAEQIHAPVFHDHDVPHVTHADNAYEHPTYGRTLFPDYLVCMECGLTMKMLKRHLQTLHGMTPKEYRSKWDLPASYPMVAPDYAKLRSSLALESGLGLKPADRPGKAKKGRR